LDITNIGPTNIDGISLNENVMLHSSGTKIGVSCHNSWSCVNMQHREWKYLFIP